jgi:cytidylate kinase
LAKGNVKENVGPYVLVSRETASGGSDIARNVSHILGWELLDEEIIDYLCSEYGTPRSLVKLVDERQAHWLEDLFVSWIEGQRFTSTTYVHGLVQLLLLAAHHGNVVVVGRGAQFILPHNRGLSVRILAPFDCRVEHVIAQRDLSLKEARRMVEESDRQREAFVKQHFNRCATDPHVYDLVINVDKLRLDEAAELIVAATKSWMRSSGVQISV